MSELLAQIKAGRKPVIGMVQLPPLAGGAHYAGSGFDAVLEVALSEARILGDNGVDAVMVQNLGDIPVALHATISQVAWMTRVVTEVQRAVSQPVGLNLLENDAEAMFAISSATAADFVRIKIYVGAMMTPFGMESAQAHTAIKARTSWNAEKTAIFADVHDRTGSPMHSGGFVEDVEFAVRLGGADGLVITGKNYDETLKMVEAARGKYPDVPILVGGGVTSANFAEVVKTASGAIVSTSMKGTGSAVGVFVPEKVKEFMSVAGKVRTG